MKVPGLAVLAALVAAPAAAADRPQVVHGLHCRTEAQVDRAIDLIRHDVPPRIAAEMLNRNEVACVFADRIWYMVEGPAIIGVIQHRGRLLVKYEGTLVGVLVGENPRPVEPPLRIYFVLPERLQHVPRADGA